MKVLRRKGQADVLGIITMAELCKFLGLNDHTIRRYVREGKLPKPMRIGGLRLWPLWKLRQRFKSYESYGGVKAGLSGPLPG